MTRRGLQRTIALLGLSGFFVLFSFTLGPEHNATGQDMPEITQQTEQSSSRNPDLERRTLDEAELGFHGPENTDKETIFEPPEMPPPAENYENSAEYGERLFVSKGCISCHAIRGMGGEVGPDLSSVGLRREYQWMVDLINNPQAVQPDSIMGQYIRGYPSDAEALARFLAHQRSQYSVSPSSHEYAEQNGVDVPWPAPYEPRWELMRKLQGVDMGPPGDVPTAQEIPEGGGGHGE